MVDVVDVVVVTVDVLLTVVDDVASATKYEHTGIKLP